MGYNSPISHYTIIGDHNAAEQIAMVHPTTGGFGGGYVKRDYTRHPAGFYAPMAAIPKIPRSEWADRIKEIEQSGAGLADLHRARKIPVLNQKQTNYCWCFGTTKAVMMAYCRLGGKVPYLSAASVAAKVTNYNNRGSWAGEALEGFQKYGASTVDFWPEAAIDRRYDTAEQQANAALHKVVKFCELPSKQFDAIASALLLGFPVTLGLDWWSHLVCGLQLRIKDGQFYVEFVNSWGTTYENEGFALLTESKATAYEAVMVQSVLDAYDAVKNRGHEVIAA